MTLRGYQGLTLFCSMVSWSVRAGALDVVGYLTASRFQKKQIFATLCGPLYSFLHNITFAHFPDSLHRRSYFLWPTAYICGVLYTMPFLTSCVCSSTVDRDRLPSQLSIQMDPTILRKVRSFFPLCYSRWWNKLGLSISLWFHTHHQSKQPAPLFAMLNWCFHPH